MSNVQRVAIVDKNGKHTHVNKKVGIENNSIRIGLSTPPSPLINKVDELPVPPLGATIELPEYDFLNSPIFENVISSNSGELLHSYNEEFDDIQERAKYLASEDGVSIKARVTGRRKSYDYKLELSMFDENTGSSNKMFMNYSTGLAWKTAPSVGDIISDIAMDAAVADEYPLDKEGVKDFAFNFGYEPVEPSFPDDGWDDIWKVLAGVHKQSANFKKLVGEARYGDYVYGRYKSDYGYNSGIKYAPEN